MMRTVGSTAALAALALLACKQGDDEKSDPVPVAPPAPTAAAPASPQPAEKGAGSGKPLFESDLSDACNEVPQKAAVEYARKAETIHPLIGFSRSSKSDTYGRMDDKDVPEGWGTENAGDYPLVLCATLQKKTKRKSCKFDSKTPVRYLDMMDATWEFSIHEAHTGKKLDSKTVNLKGKSRCPMIHFFSSEREEEMPELKQSVIDFSKPWVMGRMPK